MEKVNKLVIWVHVVPLPDTATAESKLVDLAFQPVDTIAAPIIVHILPLIVTGWHCSKSSTDTYFIVGLRGTPSGTASHGRGSCY